MITPSFGLTATERVLPRLALDFTTASLDPRVTFTRTGNTATVTNSSGYVVPINADLPRFDFDPITLVCKGLLIEESRTNALTYSEDFRNTATAGSTRPWANNDITVSINAGTSPDNANNANKLVETATTAEHAVFTPVTDYSGNRTFSIYAKKAERDWLLVNFYAGSSRRVWFNLANGTIGTKEATLTCTITDVGNGWYRCTAARSGANPGFYAFGPSSADNTVSYAGDNTKGIFTWGVQLELGLFPTSYIPTVASTVTRNADAVSMTGTNFSDWYNATEGTLSAQVARIAQITSGFPRIASISDNTNNNEISVLYDSSTPAMGLTVKTATVTVVNAFRTILAADRTLPTTVVGAYKLDNFAASAKGSAVATDSAGTLPTVNRMNIGCGPIDPTGSALINGWISKINYWPQRLTNNEVQAFSK